MEQDRYFFRIGVVMAVTKNYAERNYGARDFIVESVGLIAGILIVAFVLLFFAGGLDFGPDITAKVNQTAVQNLADSTGL